MPGQNLSSRLWGLADDPNDDLSMQVMKEVFDDVDDSAGFRWTAPKTQDRQDRHLKELLNFYRALKGAGTDASDDQVKSQLFSESAHDFTRISKGYLVLAMKYLKPRSTTDERPRYATLIERRFSILFWAKREMQPENSLYKAKFINATNEVLQFSARKYGVSKASKEKLFLGRNELSFLLQSDMFKTAYLPVAENHHLAWCLGCICGIRPGSMACSSKRPNDYMTWKDVVITRGFAKGMFNVKVTFRFLKGNRDDPAKDYYTLVFNVTAPTNPTHIPMSPALRMLVILLRRGMLADHTTINSLLCGDERTVRIKAESLDCPIFLAGGPRGLSVTDRAMSANTLTNYIHEKAMKEGFGRTTTMYAWRRKAGTEVERQLGQEMAKKFLDHDKSGITFEKHYDQGNYDLPVFELAMRGDVKVASAAMDEEASPLLTRMIDMTRLTGVFLDNAVTRAESSSQELKDAMEAGLLSKARTIKRRLRRATYAALYDEEMKLASQRMTVAEFESRKTTLKEGPSLMNRIVQASKVRQSVDEPRPATASHGEQSSAPQVTSSSSGFRYEDLKDADDFTPGEIVDVQVDDADDFRDELAEEEPVLEYREEVSIFMESAYKDRFFEPEETDQRCRLCLYDPTIDEDAKQKRWDKVCNLERHQASSIHNPRTVWIRQLKATHEASDEERWSCPYDKNCRSYAQMKRLIDHIQSSTADNTSLEHDAAKAADGWYDDGWGYIQAEADPKAQRLVRQRQGFVYSDEKESEPYQMALFSTSEITSAPGNVSYPIPPQHAHMIFSGADVDMEEFVNRPIPSMYRGIVQSGGEHRHEDEDENMT